METTCENPAQTDALSPVTGTEFKNGMRRMAGAVCILTVQNARLRAGLTATAVVSVSAEPPRLLVCVNRSVYAHDLITTGGSLCVNVLGSQHLHHARRFAGMVEGVSGDDRFLPEAWEQGVGGAPVLIDALTAFECRVTEVLSASSHSMVICEVINVHAPALCPTTPNTGQPLVYFDGRFASLGEL